MLIIYFFGCVEAYLAWAQEVFNLGDVTLKNEFIICVFIQSCEFGYLNVVQWLFIDK